MFCECVRYIQITALHYVERYVCLSIFQVYFNNADIGANVILNDGVNTLFDYIIFSYEDYYFVGPKPEKLPQIKNLSYPFDTISWTLLYVSLGSYVVASLIVQNIFKVTHGSG